MKTVYMIVGLKGDSHGIYTNEASAEIDKCTLENALCAVTQRDVRLCVIPVKLHEQPRLSRGAAGHRKVHKETKLGNG